MAGDAQGGGGGGISGVALGALAAGVLLLYAGIRGKNLLSEVQGLVQGKPPSTAAAANPIEPGATATTTPAAGSSGGGTVPATGNGQQALQQAAASYGWSSGQQWQALNYVEMAEAGYNAQATNPQSGAFGIAQALGHGEAGTACPQTGVNEYGGFGLSATQAQQANCGQAGPQAAWMCAYIAATYGDPEHAWAHEQANHWY